MSLVIVVGLGGCSGGGKNGAPEVTSTPTPSTAIEVRMPLGGYEPSKEQIAALERAAKVLLGDCGRRFGVDAAGFALPTGYEVIEERNGRRGVVLDEATARRYGYHRFTDPVGQGPAPTTGMTDSPRNRAALGVMRGLVPSHNGKPVPKGGCFVEVTGLLDKGVTRSVPGGRGAEAEVNVLLSMDSEANKQALADERVRAATVRWSACMRRAGHQYRTPDDAIGDPRWAEDDEPVTPAEISAAVADVRCQREVNLVGVTQALEIAYQKRLIEKHGEALRTVRTNLEIRLRNASRVVSGGPRS